MKVLHILNELRPSGAETMLRVAGPLWAGHGIEAHVLATGDTLGPYADALRQVGYRLHHLPLARGPVFAARLRRLCQEFDVVHVHTERANFTYGVVARSAGCRVVRTVHNVFAYQGLIRHLRRLQRACLRGIGVQHIAIGPSVAAVERDVLANPSVTVPNWYDTAAYAPISNAQRAQARAKLGLPAQAVVLTVVGNCSPIKNHAALIHAVAALPETNRSSLCVLHVGAGADERDEKALAQSQGLAAVFRFLGAQPSAVLALQAADAFVMPSVKEGLGIAALEAFGCGLPALLTDVVGLCDLRDVSPAIVWAEAPTADAVATALRQLLEGLPELSRLASNAADDVAGQFGSAVGVGLYATQYCPR
jgi:glycosyltransferase involved in cell wall biosynthesis